MQNLRLRGRPPPIIFARIVRPMNALQLCRWQFSHKETLYQTFFKQNAILVGKQPFCIFESPPLGTTYNVHLWLIGKRVVDFLLVLIELFFARCYGWGATSEYRFKIGDFAPTGPADPKLQVEGIAPHQPFFFSENWAKCAFVWYKNLERSFFCFATMHVFDRQTDRQTDRILIARPRLHCIQRCETVRTSGCKAGSWAQGGVASCCNCH